MKKIGLSLFFVFNFLTALGSTGASTEVVTRLTLMNPTEVTYSKEISSIKDASFKVSGLENDEVAVFIKEANNGKINLANSSGDKVAVNLSSNIIFNEKNVVGNFALEDAAKDLNGKMTLRVMYN